MTTIAIFPWNENFQTGIKDIDDQHRGLVDVMNDLATKLAMNANSGEIRDLLLKLRESALRHFEEEERLWHLHLPAEPELETHKQEHRRFLSNLDVIQRKLLELPTYDDIEQSLQSLTQWLVSHMIETDQGLAAKLPDSVLRNRAAGAEATPATSKGGDLLGLVFDVYDTLAANTFALMRELSRRHVVEQQLRISQHCLERQSLKYETLLRNSSDGICILNHRACVVEASDAFCDMLGYSRDEIIGMHVSRWDDLFDAKTIDFLLDKQMRSAEILTFETRHRRKDGSLLDVEITGNSFMLDGERLLFNSTRDITEKKRAEHQLASSENRLNSIIESEPECIKIVDSHGKLLQMNPAGLSLVQAQREDDVVGLCVFDLIADEHRQAFMTMHHDVIAGEPRILEFEVVGLQGKRIWVETHATPLADGDEIMHLAVTRDISLRKATEDKLRLAASVFTQANESIMITDTAGRIIDVNRAFERSSGYQRQEALGRNASIVNSDRHSAEFFQSMWERLRKDGRWSGEIWNKRKSGEIFPELLTISCVTNADGEVTQFVAFAIDITTQREQQQRLEHLAHFDALTGLPNRTLLADRLSNAMSLAQRQDSSLAIVYLDLDGFKSVNDNYGHDFGDKLLREITRRIGHILRDSDTLSRLGGDEFVILMPGFGVDSDYQSAINRILASINEPIVIDDCQVKISSSIGITFYPQDEDLEADQLLRQADQAMYQAKVQGKNRFHVFNTLQDRNLRGRHESIDRIRTALHKNEFELYYQPRVNMKTGVVEGAEALIRWNHPEEGLLPPAHFLPIIESHPLTAELGGWVINAACAQMVAWKQLGFDVPVSVNISSCHLQQSGFIADLQAVLTAHPDLEAGMLSLEVLETSALDDIDMVVNLMRCCHDIGVEFALDDFGTGYSSLTYLKRLPVNVIKIDRSFVHDMLDNTDDLRILKGIIGLAEAFEIAVIAEGVETDAHIASLLELGCNLGQGYGIARPMPADKFMHWLASRR